MGEVQHLAVLHVLYDANEIIALQLEVDGQAVFDCDDDLAKVVGLHQVGPPRD